MYNRFKAVKGVISSYVAQEIRLPAFGMT